MRQHDHNSAGLLLMAFSDELATPCTFTSPEFASIVLGTQKEQSSLFLQGTRSERHQDGYYRS